MAVGEVRTGAAITPTVSIDDDLSVADDLSVGDDLTVGKDLSVTDDASVGGDLAVTGGASVGTDLSVNDDLTVGDDATIEGDGQVDGSLSVGRGSPATNGKLEVHENAASAVAFFFNDGNNQNRMGITIQCGADDGSGTTTYVNANDGDGNQIGRIENNAGTYQLVDVSDPRVKRDIAPSKVDALEILRALNVIEFRYARQGDSAHLHPAGFDAENCRAAFPEMVSERDGLLGTSRAALIPVLVLAVQHLLAKVERREGGGL